MSVKVREQGHRVQGVYLEGGEVLQSAGGSTTQEGEEDVRYQYPVSIIF